MDAFFASVEQKNNPFLMGKPIAVAGSGARTVIVTSSYEARKLGVKTGMNIYEAKKICPNIIIVRANTEKYTYTAGELSKIYSYFTPDVEVYSIDEAFLDITTTHHLFGGVEKVALSIKKAIKSTFGINCTIGIGHNILIAKLVSDISKPDGLRWVKPEDVAGLLEDMPVKKLWGIGYATAEKLESMGIMTCGELGRASASILRRRFGIIGETLKMTGLGLCERTVIADEEEPKSIGHSMTLPCDISDKELIKAYILKLSEMVGRRARKYGYAGKTISLTIRYPDFETFTRQTAFPHYTNQTHEIYRGVLSILSRIKIKDKVRLIGVSISNLAEDSNQLSLFGGDDRLSFAARAMDAVNNRYGDFTATWALCLDEAEPARVISPAWKPEGIRNIKVV